MFPLHSVCYPHRAENECERGESRKASRVTFNTMSANMKLCVYDPTEARKQMREERILQELEALTADLKQMTKDLPEKSNSMRDHVSSLYEIAGALDSTHKSATITGVFGTGLSLAGGLVALSGAALAPFTGGASLVATVGVAGSFLGGFTRIGGGVMEKLDNSNSEKKVDEILRSCGQELLKLEDNFNKVHEKIKILEKEELKKGYRDALEKMKLMLCRYEPTLKSEMFWLALRAIVNLTVRLVSRVVVEKVSQEATRAAIREIAKEIAIKVSMESTSYMSYEAIKAFFTFSSREVSKRWYQDLARTSAMASGAASLVFLPFDVRDLYKEVTHLSKGAKSELAAEIRKVAKQLEALISQLG